MMKQNTKEELDQLLAAMIQSAEGISDLIFVAGKPPQVGMHGQLKPFALDPPGSVLNSECIEGLAGAIINNNSRLIQDLTDHGSCDWSYSLQDFCRFRVNIYLQNGNYAMVLCRLPAEVPSMYSLNLPPAFREITKETSGLIFVTGGTASGKTTTLAAMLNEINHASEVHIVTLEDSIEFLHTHLKATFSQRELGRDFYTYANGLRAALREAPKVILVGKIHDRETMEIALTAGETGHVVYSTLNTTNVSQTIQRIFGMFTRDEEQQMRERLAGTLRYIICQRLVLQKNGGRLLLTEMMGNSPRTREAIAAGETRRLLEMIEAGNAQGWHSFDQSLIKAYEADSITEETVMLYCSNKSQMRQIVDKVNKRRETIPAGSTLKMKVEEALHVKSIPRAKPPQPEIPTQQPETSLPQPETPASQLPEEDVKQTA